MRFRATLAATILVAVTAGSYADSVPGSAVRIGDVHEDLLSKFTPKHFRKGEQKLRNHTGEEDFTGDCVDYYVAAHRQLEKHGYKPYARFLHRKKDGEGHLVACVDNGKKTHCLDPNAQKPRSLGQLHREYRTVKVNRG